MYSNGSTRRPFPMIRIDRFTEQLIGEKVEERQNKSPSTPDYADSGHLSRIIEDCSKNNPQVWARFRFPKVGNVSLKQWVFLNAVGTLSQVIGWNIAWRNPEQGGLTRDHHQRSANVVYHRVNPFWSKFITVAQSNNHDDCSSRTDFMTAVSPSIIVVVVVFVDVVVIVVIVIDIVITIVIIIITSLGAGH